MTSDFGLDRESVLSFNARRHLYTAFILTSLFEPRYNPEHLYCANDDRRNDVNHFCEIASRAYNLHASLVKSQCDK